MTGARINSEHWKIERLKKGEQLVLVNRKAESVSGTISKFFEPEQFTVRQAVLIFKSLEVKNVTVIERI